MTLRSPGTTCQVEPHEAVRKRAIRVPAPAGARSIRHPAEPVALQPFGIGGEASMASPDREVGRGNADP